MGLTRTALMTLDDDLAKLGLPPFVPWTISKIGGFYLQSSLRPENEVRLLAKRHIGGPDEARKQGASSIGQYQSASQTRFAISS